MPERNSIRSRDLSACDGKVVVLPGLKVRRRSFTTALRGAWGWNVPLLVLGGILTGRVVLFHGIAPLGLAYFAAVLWHYPRRAPLVYAGVLGGYFWSHGLPGVFPYLLVISALAFADSLLLWPRSARNHPDAGGNPDTANGTTVPVFYWPGALTAFFTVLMIKLPFAYFFGVVPHDLMSGTVEAVWAGLAGLAFSQALPAALNPGIWRRLEPDRILALAFLLGSLAAGSAGLQAGPVNVARLVGALAVMVLAWSGGAAPAAAAGALIGLMVGLSSDGAPALVGVFSLAGLLAGVFSAGGRFMVAGAAGLGLMVLSPYLDGAAAAELWPEVILAALVFLVVPEGLWRRAFFARKAVPAVSGPTRVGPGHGAGPGGQGEPAMVVRPKGKRIWRAFSLRDYLEGADENPHRVAGQRLQEFAGVFRELAASFEQVSTPAGQGGQELGRLVNSLAQRVCHDCAQKPRCWRETFLPAYQQVLDLAARVEAGRNLEAGRFRAKFEWCPRNGELVTQLSHLLELHQLNHRWVKRLEDSRRLVTAQLQGVSRIMGRLADDVTRLPDQVPGRGLRVRPALLTVETGVSKAARHGRIVSGDTHLIRELTDGKFIMVLSDGMGTGTRAAMESKTAVSLLEEMLDSGFDISVAVQTVNSILLLRSPEEIFTTMDLAVIDLDGGDAQFIKIGAPPTFVKRGNRVEMIKSSSPPIGILDHIEIETSSKALTSGDTIVMITDGLLDPRPQSNRREDWLIRYLKRCPATSAQETAVALLEEARSQGEGDDMTVLVCRLRPGNMV